MFALLRESGSRASNPKSSAGLVPQLAGGLISEAVAPPAGRRGTARGQSGGTCGLISPPTWESAHSPNERGKKKTVCRCQPGPAPPPDLHGGSLFWDRDSAPTRCAACSCWPEAGGTDVPPESCASDGLRPSLFRLLLPLSSSFLLPKFFHFFLHFSPGCLLLPPSFLCLAFFMPYHLKSLTPVPVIEGGH